MGSVTVEGLGKAYKQYASRWARLAEWVTPGHKPRHSLKWVLRDMNFSVSPGEAVGILGVNGAGKSTLLKIITGTVQPTAGSVRTTGRVAALLELGMGFHPDFTGRQNAVMAAQLLGMSVEEIAGLMPDIEAFAEIGDYIDQPVRVYSSGMQVRLAFAVAVARRPDILIVDEALAVGDVYFQQKCYQRIQQYIAAGTTLLFVTHGMSTILEVCTRAIYLRSGAIAYDGSPKQAVNLYQADMLVAQDQGSSRPEIKPAQVAPEPAAAEQSQAQLEGSTGSLLTEAVTCVDARLLDEHGQRVTVVLSESRLELRLRYRIHRALDDPHVGFKIRSRTGAVIFESNTYCMRKVVGGAGPGALLEVAFAFPVDLSPGDYTITTGLANGGSAGGIFRESLSYLHDVLSFNVLPNPSSIVWEGIVNIRPAVQWQLTR
ncbi:ABC transporter ATP-binding protein [Ramlibacter henchirensis]|uniref:ABC transporter ATP-binding protein n=1 Tax=Ramlibacter henchirensis TaxID=204072 RepID=A0A4Z0C511_9BURK|nr:ABC transporter ATP-binding protein [Ramlibacter henchirensis]TFZ05165.1 ABC transporter ATP-binding protein [Ramlibacter henchirensis]